MIQFAVVLLKEEKWIWKKHLVLGLANMKIRYLVSFNVSYVFLPVQSDVDYKSKIVLS